MSLVMVDLKTQSGVAYQPDLPMPTQSTVKAIYAGALIESYPDAVQRNGQYMRDALEFSENEPYKNLRRIYGIMPMVKWCEEAGIDPDFAKRNFPRTYTARDMFKLWTKMYCFLNDGADKDNIGAYLADSSASATRKQLGDRYVVQTKAGWEGGLDEDHNFDPNEKPPAEYVDGDPSNDEVAINDTGIVYTDKGPYLFVVYTDHPFGVYRDYTDVNPLYGLVEALNKVQQSL